MPVLLIKSADVRTVADGPGVRGQLGVEYQTYDETPSRRYWWDGEKMVPDLTGAQVDDLKDYRGISPADDVLSKYGTTAFDICRTPGVGNTMIVGVTSVTHSLSNERPRFSNWTRKVTIGATTAQIRFVQMNAFFADAAAEFSFDIYLETHPTQYAGTSLNPVITVSLSGSDTTGIGSNFSRWSWSATALRQGWNTLRMRRDDTVTTVASSGNLPEGMTHPADVGTGFDWAGQCRYMSVDFANMNGQIVHVDQIRIPSKAKPILVIGFDATGYNYLDEVPITKVAPLFRAGGFGGYFTWSWLYESVGAGNEYKWRRMRELQNDWGWDAVNHTWNHGGTARGQRQTVTSLVAASDVVTVQLPGGHGVPLGGQFRANISGASISAANGTWQMQAQTDTTATYTAAGAGSATATGTIILSTFLSQVLSTYNAENLRLTRHEIEDVSAAMRATGFGRAANVIAFPNNSVPELQLLKEASSAGRVAVGRGTRYGMTQVNEFGINEPLNCGSFELGSGSGATTTSFIAAKIAAAVARGEHIWLYGHFILDDSDPGNSAYAPLGGNGTEYPPGSNGNPSPPAASDSGDGGWWYLSQLSSLVNDTIRPLIAAGTLRVMTPSEYAAHMGFARS